MKYIKRIAVVLSLILIVLLLSGCQGPNETKNNNAQANNIAEEAKQEEQTEENLDENQATAKSVENTKAEEATEETAEEAESRPVDTEREYNSNGFRYKIQDNGTLIITYYDGLQRDLIIPETLDNRVVTSIADIYCYNSIVETVTIPDTITHIGVNPFRTATDLKQISVSPDHPYLSVIDGVLFSKPDKRLICYPSELPATEYSIPDGIITIETAAFSYTSNLKSITIPKSVQTCNSNPFETSKKLEQFILSPDNQYLELVDGVLFSKTEKRLVACPAYNHFSSDEFVIPQGTEIIGESAFYECVNVSHVVMPDSVTLIEESAFHRSKLSSINIPNGVTSIGTYAFSSCEWLHEITIPGSVKEMGLETFGWCKRLTKVTIMEGAEYIGQNAFSRCTALQEVSIPNTVAVIESFAFTDCEKLEKIDLPDALTVIEQNTFDGCAALSEVILHDGLVDIGYGAFMDCTSLRTITIPDSVTSIYENAFSGCNNLTFTVGQDSYAKTFCAEHNYNYNYPNSQDWLND